MDSHEAAASSLCREIERLNEELAGQTNWIWRVCGALGIPADASSGRALEAIAELRQENQS